jgi:hypothetical protein
MIMIVAPLAAKPTIALAATFTSVRFKMFLPQQGIGIRSATLSKAWYTSAALGSQSEIIRDFFPGILSRKHRLRPALIRLRSGRIACAPKSETREKPLYISLFSSL